MEWSASCIQCPLQNAFSFGDSIAKMKRVRVVPFHTVVDLKHLLKTLAIITEGETTKEQ